MRAQCYEDVSRWTDKIDLIINRVSILNQILGMRYDGLTTNPCQFSYVRGRYVLSICGESYAHVMLYDVASADAAIVMLDALADGLWLLRRSGRLTFT